MNVQHQKISHEPKYGFQDLQDIDIYIQRKAFHFTNVNKVLFQPEKAWSLWSLILNPLEFSMIYAYVEFLSQWVCFCPITSFFLMSR